MSTKHQEMQKAIRYYKRQTGKSEIDMEDVVKFAVSTLGWKLPPPADPIKRMAQDFSQAAREEVRQDDKTGKPYRANHAMPVKQGHRQLYLWIDIDEAPRKNMHKCLIVRREQMVGDGLQLTLDADHWNHIHPEEEAIHIPMDFTEDILERKNVPDERRKAI